MNGGEEEHGSQGEEVLISSLVAWMAQVYFKQTPPLLGVFLERHNSIVTLGYGCVCVSAEVKFA
jgi:hypothetical protein